MPSRIDFSAQSLGRLRCRIEGPLQVQPSLYDSIHRRVGLAWIVAMLKREHPYGTDSSHHRA
jgi:hypothetical protein